MPKGGHGRCARYGTPVNPLGRAAEAGLVLASRCADRCDAMTAIGRLRVQYHLSLPLPRGEAQMFRALSALVDNCCECRSQMAALSAQASHDCCWRPLIPILALASIVQRF